MKDHDLKIKLKSLEIPLASQEQKERTLSRAAYAFKNSTPAENINTESYSRFSWWRIATQSMALVLIICMGRVLFFSTETRIPKIAYDAVADRTLLREMESLFPGELRAVVANGESPQLILGDGARNQNSTPVAIEFKKQGKTVRILTYSGESLELPMSDGVRRFEVLVNGRGQVLVVGDNFIAEGDKNSSKAHSTDGLSIRGQVLSERL